MNDIAKERQELTMDELEKISAGSWLGMIWNKIKSFTSMPDDIVNADNK